MELIICNIHDPTAMSNDSAQRYGTGTDEFSKLKLALVIALIYLAVTLYSRALLSEYYLIGPFYLRDRYLSKRLAHVTQKFLLSFSLNCHREAIMLIYASDINFMILALTPSIKLKLHPVSNYFPLVQGSTVHRGDTQSISVVQPSHSAN